MSDIITAKDIPDLRTAFFQADTALELWTLIESSFRNTGNFKCIEIANQMHLMARILNDENNIKALNTFYKELVILSKELEKELGIPIRVEKRQKCILRIIEKLLFYILKNDSPSKLHDVFGFRFVIGNQPVDNPHTIENHYSVVNKTIWWLVRDKLCIPILSEAPNSDDNSSSDEIENPGIYVPERSLIQPTLERYAKDYVVHPKPNLYMSTHTLFELPTRMVPRGVPFEIQFRTFAMHRRAENKAKDNPMSHDNHAESRYKDVPEIISVSERSKLHISGYNFDPENPENPENDTICLFNSMGIFTGIHS